MRLTSISAIIISACVILTSSCTNRSDNASIPEAVTVVPMQDALYSASLLDSVSAVSMLDSVISAYPDETAAILTVMGYDSVSAEAMYNLSQTRAVEIFAPAAKELAPANASISADLTNIFASASDNGLDLGNYRFATTVWGKPQSILFCDSLMLIALNHYLGADYEGYSGMDSYRRAVKTPEALPYDIAEALIATAMPYQATVDASTVNRIMYEGALTEAKMRLVAEADPAQALGYTADQYASLLKNEKWIWDKMVSEGMVFDHDPATVLRLISPAPACPIISPECLGRVGRFIGYRIVRSYFDKHPDAKLSDILSPEFYGIANPLTITGYKPR